LLELVFLGTQFLGSYFLADGFVLQPREAYHLALLLFVGGQSEIHFLNKGWVYTRDTLVLTTDSTMGSTLRKIGEYFFVATEDSSDPAVRHESEVEFIYNTYSSNISQNK
jgi:hypothetical protein